MYYQIWIIIGNIINILSLIIYVLNSWISFSITICSSVFWSSNSVIILVQLWSQLFFYLVDLSWTIFFFLLLNDCIFFTAVLDVLIVLSIILNFFYVDFQSYWVVFRKIVSTFSCLLTFLNILPNYFTFACNLVHNLISICLWFSVCLKYSLFYFLT